MAADRNTANTSGTAGGEFLTFTLGHEEYGMDILKVSRDMRLRFCNRYRQYLCIH